MNSGELGLFWLSWAQVQWTYFLPCISVLRWWTCFMISMFLTNGMPFFMSCPEPPVGKIWCGFCNNVVAVNDDRCLIFISSLFIQCSSHMYNIHVVQSINKWCSVVSKWDKVLKCDGSIYSWGTNLQLPSQLQLLFWLAQMHVMQGSTLRLNQHVRKMCVFVFSCSGTSPFLTFFVEVAY